MYIAIVCIYYLGKRYFCETIYGFIENKGPFERKVL